MGEGIEKSSERERERERDGGTSDYRRIKR